jgi:hypothetical protein
MRSSSVSIVISVLSGRIGNQGSFAGRVKRFLLLHSIQTNYKFPLSLSYWYEKEGRVFGYKMPET